MDDTKTADQLLESLEAGVTGGESPDTATENPPATAPATQESPAVAEPTDPAGETPQDTAPGEAPAATEDHEERARNRVRTTQWNEVDRLAATITAESAGKIPLKEALAQAEQMLTGKIAGEPAPEQPEADPVALLETELSETTRLIDEAAEAESVLTPELRKAQRREAELLIEIREAKAAKAEAERQQAQAADTEFDKEWNQSYEAVIADYGDTAKDDGPLGKAMLDEFDAAAKDPKHRFHKAFQAGALSPEVVAPIVARRLGIPLLTATAPQPSPNGSPRVMPVSGAARPTPSASPNAAQSEAAMREKVKAASGNPNALAALFAGKEESDIGFRMA